MSNRVRHDRDLNVLERLKRAPWLWRNVTSACAYVGATPENWLLFESISRPWWLYRSRGRLALGEIGRRSPTPVTEAEIALCERLITAFDAAIGRGRGDGDTRGLWGWLFDLYQRPLADALERHDAHSLARLLAAMFQEDFTRGLMVYAHVRNSRSWLGSRILSLKSLDVLVSLAEALGVVSVEGLEQRRAGVMFDGTLEELVDVLDTALGFRVDFPDVGAPFGLTVAGRLITLETPEQIYAAVRLRQAIGAHLPRRGENPVKVVEIGGGYGGMCYWYHKMQPEIAYTIVDLPIMNVLQGYFLSRAFGANTVSLYGESIAPIKILPNSALAEVQSPFEVLVNKDSMPEMPYDTILDYLKWGRAACHGFFYSYNHEVGVDYRGDAAGRVPQAIDQLGGFTRIRRDHSWLRRGYAEEIYVPAEGFASGGAATQLLEQSS
jgi:hypothetical protein